MSKLRCFFNCYQLAYATLFFLSTKEEEFYKMTKLFNLLGVGVTFLFLSGCASNSGEYPSARTPSTAPSLQSKGLKNKLTVLAYDPYLTELNEKEIRLKTIKAKNAHANQKLILVTSIIMF